MWIYITQVAPVTRPTSIYISHHTAALLILVGEHSRFHTAKT